MNAAETRDWRAAATCRDHDPETWFQSGESTTAKIQTIKAKQICNTQCPVRAQCLQWAIEQRIEHGVWGGLDQDELYERVHRRRRAPRQPAQTHDAAPCGTRRAYKRHLRRGETPCQPCNEANTNYVQNPQLRHQDLTTLHALAEGVTTSQLADRLAVTRKTAASYVLRLRKALQVDSDDEILDAARAAGLLPAIEYARAA